MATTPDFDDADIPAAARFSRAVADLLSKRQAAGEQFPLAVFLMSDSLAADVRERNTEHVPLLANGNDPIGARIWLAQAQVRNAYALATPLSDAAEAFQMVSTGGLSNRPAIVVDGRAATWHASLYPRGLAFPEMWLRMDLSDGPIAEADLKATIHRFWYQGLRTPDVARQSPIKIWKSAADGWPEQGPEGRLQGRLRDVLFGAYPRRKIRAEVKNEEGRADIFIVGHATAASGVPAQVTDWVLELKALCDKTTNGGNVDETTVRAAVTKGVAQATLYRDTQNGVQAAVCCFDMRSTDEDDEACFAHVKTAAEAREVRLWRWPLFRAADDARMASFASLNQP